MKSHSQKVSSSYRRLEIAFNVSVIMAIIGMIGLIVGTALNVILEIAGYEWMPFVPRYIHLTAYPFMASAGVSTLALLHYCILETSRKRA